MAKEKLKILIIDDDPKISWILSEGLSNKFDFVSAGDGIEGIQKVTTEKPDLILLDIKMPGMNGIEVLEKLNKLDDRPEVIMVSGHGETQYVVDSIKLGASEFVNKPFDVHEIEIQSVKKNFVWIRNSLFGGIIIGIFVGIVVLAVKRLGV